MTERKHMKNGPEDGGALVEVISSRYSRLAQAHSVFLGPLLSRGSELAMHRFDFLTPRYPLLGVLAALSWLAYLAAQLNQRAPLALIGREMPTLYWTLPPWLWRPLARTLGETPGERWQALALDDVWYSESSIGVDEASGTYQPWLQEVASHWKGPTPLLLSAPTTLLLASPVTLSCEQRQWDGEVQVRTSTVEPPFPGREATPPAERRPSRGDGPSSPLFRFSLPSAMSSLLAKRLARGQPARLRAFRGNPADHAAGPLLREREPSTTIGLPSPLTRLGGLASETRSAAQGLPGGEPSVRPLLGEREPLTTVGLLPFLARLPALVGQPTSTAEGLLGGELPAGLLPRERESSRSVALSPSFAPRRGLVEQLASIGRGLLARRLLFPAARVPKMQGEPGGDSAQPVATPGLGSLTMASERPSMASALPPGEEGRSLAQPPLAAPSLAVIAGRQDALSPPETVPEETVHTAPKVAARALPYGRAHAPLALLRLPLWRGARRTESPVSERDWKSDPDEGIVAEPQTSRREFQPLSHPAAAYASGAASVVHGEATGGLECAVRGASTPPAAPPPAVPAHASLQRAPLAPAESAGGEPPLADQAPPPREGGETATEGRGPDLDALAHDVLEILKWRLTVERERAWGLS